MSAALRIKSRLNNTLMLNPYIERTFEAQPQEEPLLPPAPLEAPTPTGPDVRHIVETRAPSSMRALPVLPTMKMRDIIKFKLQTCFVGTLRQLDMLRQTDPEMVPNRDEALVLQHLLEIMLHTTNSGVMSFALMRDPDLPLTTTSPSEALVADRDLLMDEHVFDAAFWRLYQHSVNSEDPQGDPMARSRHFREFMVKNRVALFRLFNVQMLNIVESPYLHSQNKQLTQLLFNVVWCVCGIDNCRLMKDPSVWQETLNKMARCGRLMDDRPARLLRVLQNMGAVLNVNEAVVNAVHDAVAFVGGIMLDRYFDSAFAAHTANLLYSSLNDYDQTYVDNAQQSMCSGNDNNLGCFMFVRFDKAKAVIMAWGTYFFPERMRDASLVGMLLNRTELARLAKYIEMRLYAWLYFVGKIRTLLMRQVQFRMGSRVVSVDNAQNRLDDALVGEMFRYAALATAVMDSGWGVQALEMLPLIAIDFDDDVTEHELEQVRQIARDHSQGPQNVGAETAAAPEEAVEPQQELPEEQAELGPEDFGQMFGFGEEEEEGASYQESGPVMKHAASQEELEELFNSPAAPKSPRGETMNEELFQQSPAKPQEEAGLTMLPINREGSVFGEGFAKSF